MTVLADYTKAVSAAQKMLSKAGTPGKPAALPKLRVEPEEAIAASARAGGEVLKKIDKFVTDMRALDAASMDPNTTADQYIGLIKASNFGLDDKYPKNKKIIADVTTIMLDALKDVKRLGDKGENLVGDLRGTLSEYCDRINRLG